MKSFKEPIGVTKPLIPNNNSAIEMFSKVIESEWLTNNGPKHQKLENELINYLKVNNLSLFNNGTMALLMGLEALELEGEVITTPFTFPATVEALDWQRLTPVFCDIEPNTFTIDASKIEELITDQTTAILPVHVFGNPCDVDKIQEIADRYKLKVIYDGAHAFGMNINGVPSGQHGDMTMFSFHATKLFNTIEGGGLVFQDKNLKTDLEALKNFGVNNKGNIVRSGLNAKLNEFQSGFGIEVLKEVLQERKLRHKIKKVYDEMLGDIEGVRIVTELEGYKSSYQYFAIEIEEKAFGCNRNSLHEKLKEYNVFTKKYFYPLCSNFDWYINLPSADKENLPVANEIVEKVLTLPFYGKLDLEDVRSICEIISLIHKKELVRSDSK